MKTWYEKENGKWIFCYSFNQKEQEQVDKVMPDAIKVFLGEKVDTSIIIEADHDGRS